ncbi:MAG TPA: cytochrome c biogenesis protein CcdA [Myxococcota bacterium]|nr:cytochrome c biogenesis protein CcdA [Myxococcota bacterium]
MITSLTPGGALAADKVGLSPGAASATAAISDEAPLAQRLKTRMLAALNSGAIIWALLIAFLAGLLTSLMGCVYPLIPVVMAVIGTRETKSRLGALGLSAVYVGGMCLLYTVLGLIFASLGKAFGSWMASPWVMGVIVVFFVMMGVAMAGVFELRLPAAIEGRLNRLGGKGVAGAFLAGLVSGLVMAPCTGPVLSVVLVYIARSQSFFLGFWLLLSLSLGTGVLFLVIGTFSGLAARLPRSGSWMESVRSTFAMVMIGMAFFFLRGMWPGLHHVAASISVPGWIGLGTLVLSALVGGFHLSFPDSASRQRIRKLTGLVLGSAGVFLLATSFFLGTASVSWVKDVDRALLDGRRMHKPVMLDFWATWCPACLKLDKQTFSDSRVADEIKRFIAVKVDCTGSADDERVQKLMERYRAMDLPTLRFVDGSGRLLAEPTVKGFVSADRMLRLLREIR